MSSFNILSKFLSLSVFISFVVEPLRAVLPNKSKFFVEPTLPAPLLRPLYNLLFKINADPKPEPR